MKERPIIFTTENVKAILEGRKTQTRRVIKPQPNKPIACAHDWEWKPAGMLCYDDYFRNHAPNYCPYGQVGDRLWVRRTKEGKFIWKKSLAEIWLEITGIRVERLQEITNEDIKAEGFDGDYTKIGYTYVFGQTWNLLNSKYPWGSKPFVWVITFKPVKEGKDERD
jgi:hypothetical protein